MTDLHYALLLLAAVVLVLLFAYDKWQQRQALKRLESTLRDGVGDALLEPAAPCRPGQPVRIEPRFETVAQDAPSALPPASAHAAAGWIEDPLLDCVLELRCAHAVDGVAVLEAVAGLQLNRFALPVFVAAWDARAQQWVHADRFGFYTELLVAIQLANRRVALDAVEASRFLSAAQQVALALDAEFDPPDIAQVVAAANALAATCARFDVQIGLTLEPNGAAWDAARVAAAAARAQFTAAGDGRWQRRGADGAVLYSLALATPNNARLSLELDVPLAPPAAAPLRAMFACAQTLAAELDARIVDDNRQPIDAGALAAVQDQLDALYAQMRQAGIEPASPRAVRLYA